MRKPHSDLRALSSYDFKAERFRELRFPVMLQFGTFDVCRGEREEKRGCRERACLSYRVPGAAGRELTPKGRLRLKGE